MKKQQTDDAKRLIPSAPPARLPEEELLTRLKTDKAYRRNASLARSLLYHPQRLFTSGAPSRLPPPKKVKELRYRMIAVATSFALLLGMVNFGPLNLLSLMGKSKANAADPNQLDYSWLISPGKDGKTEATAYEISSPGQLNALSQLVGNLTGPTSTFNITIGNVAYTVGPGCVDVLPTPAINFLPAPADTATPSPSASPTPSPSESTEPSVSPAPSPGESTEPSASPTPPPSESTEPSVSPTPSPGESPEPSVSPTPSPSESIEPSASPTPSPDETSAPAPTEIPEEPIPAAVEPELSIAEPTDAVPTEDIPAATQPVASQPEENAAPDVPQPEVTQPAENAPEVTPSATPAPAPSADAGTEPSLAPPTDAANSNPLMDRSTAAAAYSLCVPLGLAGRYIKLTSDINLDSFSGGSLGVDLSHWTPIGTLRGITSAGNKVTALDGLPFLGTFDGNHYTVYNFAYAPDPAAFDPTGSALPTPAMVGYGLFGYVGATGVVKNLTVRTAQKVTVVDGEDVFGAAIPWNLSNFLQVTGGVATVLERPLGRRSYSVGVLAAASSGTLEGCTVTQAELSYRYVPPLGTDAAASVAVGGLAGIVHQVTTGAAVSGCTFLGKISNHMSSSIAGILEDAGRYSYAMQRVGGIAGTVSGTGTVNLTNCAAGVEMDIYNGGATGQNGGVGGILGYASAQIALSGCFSTGIIYSNHDMGGIAGRIGAASFTDSFSTVTPGKTTQSAGKDSSSSPRTPDVDLSANSSEGIGGVFGTGTGAVSLHRVYFAGGLLEPQFGAIAGAFSSEPTMVDVATDATQVPHSPFKSPKTATTIARNLNKFSSFDAWDSTDTARIPQLGWATTASDTVKALSLAATHLWVSAAYIASNAVSGSDGEKSLYRLTDSAASGATLDGLTARSRTYLGSDGTTVLGGVFTGSVIVAGVTLPTGRCAVSAANATEGEADLIKDSATLHRFLERANRAGSGYLGSVHSVDGTVTCTVDGTAAGAVVPIPNYAGGTLFCGTLQGINAGTIAKLTFTTANSVGMLCTVYQGTFKDLTLNTVSLNAGVTAADGYFGTLAGQVVGVTATNVAVNGFSYQYSTTGNTGGHDTRHTAIGTLFGSATGTPFLVQNCTVSDMDVNLSTSATNTQIAVGGILGKISSTGDFFFADCTVDTSIIFAFTGKEQAKPDQNAAPSAGGIVGYDNTGGKAVLNNCHVTGRLEAGNTGGMLSRCRYYALTNCTFTGTIATAAGISSDASITGTSSGGLIAFPEHSGGGGPITGCAVLGHIEGTGSAGGLIGTLYSGSTTTAITNSYVSGVMETTSGAAGGLVGFTKLDHNKLTIEKSYFAGQVNGAMRGALVGSGSKLASATFQTALYDSTLVKSGVSAVGDAAGGDGCGAGPEDTRWNTLFAAAPWVSDSTGYHYPQLTSTGTTDFKHYSTLKLFRLTGASESLYDVKLGDQFQTVLPVNVTATLDGSAPFAAGSPETDAQGYVRTAYAPKASTASFTGPISLRYGDPGLKNSLSIPYTVGIKLFDHGSGKQTDPFIIPDVNTLYTFKSYVELGLDTSGTYYIISGTDRDAEGNYLYPSVVIDMDGEPFWPGISYAFSGYLTGCITDLDSTKLPADGKGQRSSVIGLTAEGSTDATSGIWSAGFFSSLTGTAVVTDLMLTMDITGPDRVTNASSGAGILSASATGGTVRNVWVEGSITANRTANVGGLIGRGNLASGGRLLLSNIYSDVSIRGSGGSGESTSGAGGLLGRLSADVSSSSAPVNVSITQCASYGSLTDWGAVGGLIGFLDSEKVTLAAKDCLSLSVFTDDKVSLFSSLGGLLGSIRNVRYGDTVVDSSYYAGENYVLSSPTRVVGGLAGRVYADAGYEGTPSAKDSPNDFTNLTFKDCVYNYDPNRQAAAVLRVYQPGADGLASWTNQGSRQWPDADHGLTHPAGQPNVPDNVSYGTRFLLYGNAFGMSQGPESASNQMVQGLSWPTNGSWTFVDGLFPRLNWITEYPAPSSNTLLAKHIAIHYTPAMEENTSTNIYVRYKSETQRATLSPTSTTNLRATQNGLMAVSTTEGQMQAVNILLDGVNVRTVYITPSVKSLGVRDVSCYTINPDGMWGTGREWTVYNADALAGLSTIYSDNTQDSNNVPVPDAAHRPGAQSTDRILLGRSIDLGVYSGMDSNQSWYPIGSETHPFSICFDGQGYTLYNLAMNPFTQTPNNNSTHYTYVDRDSPMGLFGTIDGGTVKNLVLAGTESKMETTIYQRAGIRVGMGTTVAGTLAATVKNGTLENCLVSVPVYTMGSTPKAVGEGSTENWSGVPYLGVSANAPLGGLVGQVTENAVIKNCAYTGYVYGAAQSARPDATGVTAPDSPVAGPVGGLVGEVTASASLTVENSYMAGLVDGGTVGALVGASAGAVTLTDVSYDQNAVGGSAPALGTGTAVGRAATQVPAEMGEGWIPATPAGLYPVQASLSAASGSLAARLRIDLSPHASSAVSGIMAHTEDGAALIYSDLLQPVVVAIPGQVNVTENRFEKTVDGLTQLELQQNGYARRVLVNVRCWYNDMTPETTPDGLVVRHYTVTTAEELWELGQIVGGTIHDSAVSKVGHTHTLTDGYDDFKNAVIHFSGDVDLSTLMDVTESATTKRPWMPIGTAAHPFAGTFLGGGHAVSGMEVSGTMAGLFGTVAGTVRDLLVTNASLALPDSSSVGGLLCATLAAGGQLLDCGTSGSGLSVSGGTLGGLVGQSQGSVTGCFSTAELTGTAAHLGGIAGSNSGSIEMSYFTGYANAVTPTVVGGIAGDNSGTVSHCYVSAYLMGGNVYYLAPLATDSVYDGRHTSKEFASAPRLDGGALVMGTGWTENTGNYYPIPNQFTAAELSGTPLGQGAKLAAAIFTFSGAANGNYARFGAVSVGGMESGHSLRSGNSSLLSVSGNTAQAIADATGGVALRLGLLNGDQMTTFQRPCWLIIPTTLAVTYRFNWDDFITGSTPKNKEYNVGTSTVNTWSASGTTHTISTANDWKLFAQYVNGGGTTLGHTFTLAYDINFAGSEISTLGVPFKGTFLGGGHILRSFTSVAPLFSSVELGARVELLALDGGHLSRTAAAGDITIGLLAGVNYGRIANIAADNCSVTINRGGCIAELSVIGGLVGENVGVMDSCYMNSPSPLESGKILVTYPNAPTSDAIPNLQMGGLVGLNSGSIIGCYVSLYPGCSIKGSSNNTYIYLSTLVGLNAGGAIRYTYWKGGDRISDPGQILYSAYRERDMENPVPGKDLFMGDPSDLTVRWLSADSYGGAYYLDAANEPRLFAFRLIQYDLSSVFAPSEPPHPQQQYMMLALQFGSGGDMLFSNAICSWKDYLLPNFSNLPDTASLRVHMPILSSHLTYELSTAYVIRRDTVALAQMGSLGFSGAAKNGFSIPDLGVGAVRVFLDITLSPATTQTMPWGVYRKDSTLPILTTP